MNQPLTKTQFSCLWTVTQTRRENMQSPHRCRGTRLRTKNLTCEATAHVCFSFHEGVQNHRLEICAPDPHNTGSFFRVTHLTGSKAIMRIQIMPASFLTHHWCPWHTTGACTQLSHGVIWDQ